MAHLKGLTNLKELDLGLTEVTDAGVEKLRQAAEATAAAGDPVGPRDPGDEPEEVITERTQFSAHFDGASVVDPVGMDRSETIHNYYVGDEANWQSGVPTFETVAYPGLYDGIDLYTWGRRDSWPRSSSLPV